MQFAKFDSKSANMRRNGAQFRELLQGLQSEADNYIGGLGEPHPFIERLLRRLQWTKADLAAFVREKHVQLAQSCSDRALVPGVGGESRIEKFCHKIWLTAAEEPCLPPDELLRAYFAMCSAHPSDWTHMFWTNSVEVLRHVSSLARDHHAKVLVQNVNDLASGQIQGTLHRLIADRKFVLAADVLKFVVLDRFGGIYSDLGVVFDESILEIAAAADFTFLLASNVFFQTSWISLAKGSLLSSVFLGIMNYPEILSADYALDESGTVNAGTEVHTFAGLGYTTCALLFMPADALCFMFPENLRQLKWKGQQSWYGDAPKFGNTLINKSLPSIFRQERYADYARQATGRVRAINASARLTEMAQIIGNLFEYFQSNPPLICRCLAYNGGDKVGGWHNYGYLYYFLLEVFAPSHCTMLEVGDARSLWGRPGSKEAHPLGGSIRAWREYKGAIAVGAEIERSRQAASALDETVLINGRARVTLREQITQREYDVIIDNGFHHFDASVSLLEAAMPQLSKSGLHVIEAVPLGDIERWEAYLSSAGNTALIMTIPSAVNDRDNCLIIVVKGARWSRDSSSYERCPIDRPAPRRAYYNYITSVFRGCAPARRRRASAS